LAIVAKRRGTRSPTLRAHTRALKMEPPGMAGVSLA
jgi:hypothetical protein